MFELIRRHCLAAVNEWETHRAAGGRCRPAAHPGPIPEARAHAQAEAIHAEFVAAGAAEAIVSTDVVVCSS